MITPSIGSAIKVFMPITLHRSVVLLITLLPPELPFKMPLQNMVISCREAPCGFIFVAGWSDTNCDLRAGIKWEKADIMQYQTALGSLSTNSFSLALGSFSPLLLYHVISPVSVRAEPSHWALRIVPYLSLEDPVQRKNFKILLAFRSKKQQIGDTHVGTSNGGPILYAWSTLLSKLEPLWQSIIEIWGLNTERVRPAITSPIAVCMMV